MTTIFVETGRILYFNPYKLLINIILRYGFYEWNKPR